MNERHHVLRALWCFAVLGALPFSGEAAAQRPNLTLTPGERIVSIAGTGKAAFSGDGSSATYAAFALPRGVAADSRGRIYVADTMNQRIRRVDPDGVVRTVAGSGEQGYAGDGGAAITAFLNNPSAIALDGSDNLYIADTGNHRIRRVSAIDGTISTVAGTGIAGYYGDNGQANKAALRFPSGVAVDSGGNAYIADTQNHVIRKVSAGIITTIAGNGSEGFSGDGGPSGAASLDSPYSVAIDRAGVLFIADSMNHRIRKVLSGIITTFAGVGSKGFSGDGGPATSAELAYPTAISITSEEDVLIADSDNHSIRRVRNGSITTIVGTGVQAFQSDGEAPNLTPLDTPRGVLGSSNGTVIADTGNNRIRAVEPILFSFLPQPIGTSSAAQVLTLSNSGAAALTVQSIQPTQTAFRFSDASSCPTSGGFVIEAASSCNFAIIFNPSVLGSTSGQLAIAHNGSGSPAVISFSGSSVQDRATVVLSSSANSVLGEKIQFVATVSPADTTEMGLPSGSVIFSDGTLTLASIALSNAQATFATQSLSTGTHTILASYSGDAYYSQSTSTAQVHQVAIADFSLIAGNEVSLTAGSSATLPITVSPNPSPYNFAVTNFQCSGLPAGASCTFSKSSVTPADGATTVDLTIATTASSSVAKAFAIGVATFALIGMVSIPAKTRRRATRKGIVCVISLLVLGACGGRSRPIISASSGTPSGTYNISVSATGLDNVMRTSALTLKVQ